MHKLFDISMICAVHSIILPFTSVHRLTFYHSQCASFSIALINNMLSCLRWYIEMFCVCWACNCFIYRAALFFSRVCVFCRFLSGSFNFHFFKHCRAHLKPHNSVRNIYIESSNAPFLFFFSFSVEFVFISLIFWVGDQTQINRLSTYTLGNAKILCLSKTTRAN